MNQVYSIWHKFLLWTDVGSNYKAVNYSNNYHGIIVPAGISCLAVDIIVVNRVHGCVVDHSLPVTFVIHYGSMESRKKEVSSIIIALFLSVLKPEYMKCSVPKYVMVDLEC